MLDLSNYALKNYNDGLQQLATFLKEMIDDAIAIETLVLESLKNPQAAAEQLVEGNLAKKIDKQMNRLETDIIQLVQETISKFSPMGDSLRFMIGCIKLSTLLELIGDRAKNTYKRLHKIQTPLTDDIRLSLSQMMSTNIALLKSSSALIEDYIEEIAKTTVEQFREVEGLYKQIWPQKTLQDADYHNVIMIAKNQQHIADMLVDIKRILYFVHTGKTLEHKLGA